MILSETCELLFAHNESVQLRILRAQSGGTINVTYKYVCGFYFAWSRTMKRRRLTLTIMVHSVSPETHYEVLFALVYIVI